VTPNPGPPRLLLVGMMGAGKTTAGRESAARLGCALRRAVTGTEPVVVSVAGGAVLDPANRELLGSSGTVVWLRARPATLAARVGDGHGRPLLDEDPAAAVARLDDVRRPHYVEVADAVVDVDDLEPGAVVDAVLAALAARHPEGSAVTP